MATNEFSDVTVALWSEKTENLPGLEIALLRLGLETRRAKSLAQLGLWVESHSVDIILTPACSRDASGFRLLTGLDALPAAPPVIVVCCGADMELYLEAMRRGAFDCLAWPLDEAELERILKAALESSEMHQPA